MMQFERFSQLHSSSSIEDSNQDQDAVETVTPASKFDLLSKHTRIFDAIIKHLTDTSARQGKVLEKLTDHSYRKFAFTQIRTQANICLDLLLEIYTIVSDQSFALLLIKMSDVIQQKTRILDEFFSWISGCEKGLRKDSIKNSIKCFYSTKTSEMKALSLKMNELQKQLSEKIQSCHERSKYEKELVRDTAKPFFNIGKTEYEEEHSSSMLQRKGFKYGDDDLGYQKCLVSGSCDVGDNESPQLNSNMEDIVGPDSFPSRYDNLSSNIRIFNTIIKQLTGTSARQMKVLEKLTDHSYRQFAFTQLTSQAKICLNLLLEMYSIAKDEHVGFLLSEMSKVIQIKIITLGYFFSGIAEFSKGFVKDNQKDIIEYFNSFKQTQINSLCNTMNKLKDQLQNEIQSCQERSLYEKELFLKKAKSIFHMEKFQFEITSNPVVQERKGMKRKRNGTQDNANLLLATEFPYSTKQGGNHQEYVNEYTSYKSQDCKYQQLEKAHKKEESTTDNLNHHERRSNRTFELKKENHDSPIRNGTVAKKLLKNVPVLSTSNTVDNIDISKATLIGKSEKLMVQSGVTKPVLSYREKENERSIEFAMRFLSRSIKTSSKGNNFKKFENLTRNNMHKVISLAKNGVISNATRPMKRKRENTLSSVVTKSEPLSTANSLDLRCEKRCKFDSVNKTYQSKIILNFTHL